MSSVKYITFVFVLLAFQQLGAQIHHLRFQSYNTKDGLSQTHVLCIYQDSKGYLWFGTYNGLNRFDGKNFKVYQLSKSNSNTISGNWIKNITEDRDGNLWVSTYTSGVNKIDMRTQKIFRYQYKADDKNALPSNETYQIHVDDKGLVWIATARGLCRYNEKKKNFITYTSNLESEVTGDANIVYAIHEIDEDTLWLGTDADELILFSRSSGLFSSFSYKKPAINTTGNFAKVVASDSRDNLWVGAINHGLFRIDTRERKSHYYNVGKGKFQPSSRNVRSIFVDEKDNIWVGTDGGGLNIFNRYDSSFIKYEFKQYRKYGLTSGNGIYSIFKDKDGRIWMGLYNGGICYYDPQSYKFDTYYHDIYDNTSISENAILSLFQDSKGRIWVGTDGGGLNHFDKDRGTFKRYMHDPNDKRSIASNVITAIQEDNEGNLLLGTWNEGFMIYSPETGLKKQYRSIPGDTTGLPHDDVWSIVKDNNGDFWIGTLKGGIAMYDPESDTFEQFGPASNRKSKPLHYDIRTMFVDKDGIIWAGTLRTGVTYFNPSDKEFKYILHNPDNENSLSKNDVRSIYRDHKGNMWFGTNGGGLNKYYKSTGKFELYTVNNNLPGDAIHGIQEDRSGNLWISTTNGICRFNPVSKDVRNYGISDGLQGNDFKYNSSLKTHDGYLLFGGIDGLSVFHPDSVIENTKKPEIVFTDFRLNNESVIIGGKDSPLQQHVDYVDEVVLTYNQKSFSIEFAALNYTAPDQNQYAYKLEEFDEDWQYSGNHNVATYTNLDPGEYTFRVIASNNDNVWNKEGRTLTIIVLKPFWMKWWFISILILFAILVAYALNELRVYRIKRRYIELEKIVDQRTSELMEINSMLKKRTDELNQSNKLLETEQKHVRDQAKILSEQKEKLEEFNNNLVELNATKDKFFSIIAHDLRNPFNTLIGFLDMLVEKYEQWNNEKRLEIIDLIRRDVNKTFGLLENLLEWSKTQRGILNYNPEPVDLNELIEFNTQQFLATAQAKKIELLNTVGVDSPVVIADKHLLNTIFRNLVSNAIKFTNSGGFVKIEAHEGDRYIEIVVVDNGVGIEKETQEKLFRIDKHHSTYGTEDEKGSGLGLILCKEFVKKLKGRIWIHSEIGKGSEFHFTIPKT